MATVRDEFRDFGSGAANELISEFGVAAELQPRGGEPIEITILPGKEELSITEGLDCQIEETIFPFFTTNGAAKPDDILIHDEHEWVVKRVNPDSLKAIFRIDCIRIRAASIGPQ